MMKNYYELRRIKPRLRRLKECLEEAPYSGETSESDIQAHTVNGFFFHAFDYGKYCCHCCISKYVSKTLKNLEKHDLPQKNWMITYEKLGI